MLGGRYISLANASILPQIIIGGATEEAELEVIGMCPEHDSFLEIV
jgi:hypothetical protein